MIDEETVRLAYRLILGREAESDAVVAELAGRCDTVAQVRAAFLRSPEGRRVVQGGGYSPFRFEGIAPGGPKIGFLGSCQSPEVARHFSAWTGLATIGRDIANFDPDLLHEWIADLDEADHIVMAPLSDAFAGIRREDLEVRKPGRVHTMLSVHFYGLHPDEIQLGSRTDRVHGPLVNHSRLILRGYLLGMSERDCARQFTPETFAACGYLDEWAASEEEFRRRDAAADVRLADRFFETVRERLLLLTPNHIAPVFARLMCEEVCRALDLPQGEGTLDNAPTFHAGGPIWPVYDAIAEHHRLGYRTAGTYMREGQAFDLPTLVARSYEAYDALPPGVLAGAVAAKGLAMFEEVSALAA